MKQKLLSLATTGLLMAAATFSNAQVVTTFDYTGSMETYTVPPGVTEIQIEAYGASGQLITVDDYGESSGGLGGYAIGLLSVTPGEVLNIYVGGEGTDGVAGYNGGGTGGLGTAGAGGTLGYGGSGGGASDVRVGGTALADRVIVAGGGGGGGRNYVNGTCVPCGQGGNGGAGGGTAGVDGSDPTDPIYGVYFNAGAGGGGGTAAVGGAGGAGTEGTPGNPGTLGVGGNGINATQGAGSGGGGGGYYGGGAGAAPSSGSGAAGGGGAGGSSYLGTLTDASTTPGLNEGNGQIILTLFCDPITTEASALEICEGDEVTLTATSPAGGTITFEDGIESGVPFTPTETGTLTYAVTSDAEDECGHLFEILVNELPTITAIADDASICEGDEITLTGTGAADEYTWNYGAVDGVAYDPELAPGEYTFEVIGLNTTTECENTATIEITVNELPIVTATSDKEIYCDGDLITLTGAGADTYTWDMGVEDGVGFTQAIGTVTYGVIGTNADECTSISTIDVTVVENPTISVVTSDELFGGDGTATATVGGGAAPYSFDWDNDGTGDFDDDQDQTTLDGGTYTVVIQDANGCTATETVIVNSQLGINGDALIGLEIYPNPTRKDFKIQYNGAFAYTLYSFTGEIILSGAATNVETLDASELAAGVYLVEIKTANQAKTVKLIKQ